ncbi:hypothetical protein H072_10642 [Dactylellina haptotyla CBS 200.50]|uniref:Uncharacterized protein n=1 Tax=Dactylellina haptotyla (strain CBS 200.50) TaxID=1284197 RepID=S7ZYU5_DACHA|nr:hypothetical protein H072_10642 [Dactylellina haptotyla CBS 200.50]
MSTDEISPVRASKDPSRFSFFRPRISRAGNPSSTELPFLSSSKSDSPVYQDISRSDQRAGSQSPDGRLASSKTSIFKSENHRVKHSLIRGSKAKRVGEISFHFFISLIALIFLVIPILAYKIDGNTVDESDDGGYGGRILKLIQYGPTIFPIIFAAITGHFLRSIALKLAERGTTLETLEQLIRSNTVASSITTPYLLSSYNVLSVALLFLWAVSPLGGQASLRILRTAFVEIQSEISSNYLDPFNQVTLVGLGSDVGLPLSESTSIYVSSLLGSAVTKAQTVDSWGNVKIPLIESLEGNKTAVSDPERWYTPPQQNITYSSLLGNPVTNLTTNSTTMIQSGYATINCSRLDLVDTNSCDNGNSKICFNTTNPRDRDWIFPANPLPDDNEAPTLAYLVFGLNKTQTQLGIANYDGTSPMNVVIQSRGQKGTSVGHCVLSQTFVEAQVDCVKSICRIGKLRRLDVGPKRPPSFVNTPGGSTYNFFRFFAELMPPGHSGYSSPSQLYILYPSNPFAMQNTFMDLATVGKEEFGIRLTQLFNTFLSSSYGGGLYLGSTPIAKNSTMWFGNGTVNFKTVVGTKTEIRHIYVAQRTWAAITILASLLLLCMGIASAIVGFFTLAPDILTSLSALANESPWFDTYKEGTTLDGDAKAAALKKRVVKLGDVKRFEDVGYISLGTIDTGVGSVEDLSTDRAYR